MQSFLLTDLAIVLCFSLRWWQACISRSSIFTPISSKRLLTLLSKLWSLIDEDIPITSTVSQRRYWALVRNRLSVCTSLSIGFEFTFIMTAKSVSSFLKYPSRSFTSVVRFVICETELASVCSTSCTSSDLPSLFKTASVWVVAITQTRSKTSKTKNICYLREVWLGVLTYNFLCKNTSVFTQHPQKVYITQFPQRPMVVTLHKGQWLMVVNFYIAQHLQRTALRNLKFKFSIGRTLMHASNIEQTKIKITVDLFIWVFEIMPWAIRTTTIWSRFKSFCNAIIGIFTFK